MAISSMYHVFFVVLLTTCAGFEGESACENTCVASEGVSLITRCHCDSTCAVIYNDCCYDSPYKLRIPPDNIPKWECLFVAGEGRHFFVIGRCQDGWDGDREVIDKCEKSSSVIEDPVGQVPVTSRTTEVTYKNYYCASCNDDVSDAVSWKIRAQCENRDLTLDDVQKNLEFNRERRRWGVYKKEPLTERRIFHECSIIFQRPDETSKESVRECVPGLISSCPPSWRDVKIKRKCLSYINPVFWSQEESYRNIYCAICNHKSTDDYWCRLDANHRPNAININLGHIMKPNIFYNTSTHPCKENEIYDPWMKKKTCRQTVHCRRGYVVRNDKCVREF